MRPCRRPGPFSSQEQPRGALACVRCRLRRAHDRARGGGSRSGVNPTIIGIFFPPARDAASARPRWRGLCRRRAGPTGRRAPGLAPPATGSAQRSSHIERDSVGGEGRSESTSRRDSRPRAGRPPPRPRERRRGVPPRRRAPRRSLRSVGEAPRASRQIPAFSSDGGGCRPTTAGGVYARNDGDIPLDHVGRVEPPSEPTSRITRSGWRSLNRSAHSVVSSEYERARHPGGAPCPLYSRITCEVALSPPADGRRSSVRARGPRSGAERCRARRPSRAARERVERRCGALPVGSCDEHHARRDARPSRTTGVHRLKVVLDGELVLPKSAATARPIRYSPSPQLPGTRFCRRKPSNAALTASCWPSVEVRKRASQTQRRPTELDREVPGVGVHVEVTGPQVIPDLEVHIGGGWSRRPGSAGHRSCPRRRSAR